MRPFNVGIIGVEEDLSEIYIRCCQVFDILHLAAIADDDMESARSSAAKNLIPLVQTADELLTNSDIDIVVNLTGDSAVSLKVLEAGKHLYSEYPLAETLDNSKALLEFAGSKNLWVGGAPDTFLFAKHQTMRAMLEDEEMSEAESAALFLGDDESDVRDSWQVKPLLDLGPGYVSCLVNLFGPVVYVGGAKQIADETNRTPRRYTGTLEFASGIFATLITDWRIPQPMMEIFGGFGTLLLKDSDGINPAEIRLYVPDEYDWELMPITYPATLRQGVGLAEMASAIRDARSHRASGELAYHVMEIMQAIERTYVEGGHFLMNSTCARPQILPPRFLSEQRKIDS